MLPTKKQLKIIEGLAEIESTAGKLYKVYSEKFPDHKDFWLSLVVEEENHAELIRSLFSSIEKGAVYFKEKNCSDAIDTLLNYMKKYIDDATKNKVILMNALFLAEEIEKGLINNIFFSFLEGDSSEFNQVIVRVLSGAKEHIKKIHKYLAENRPN